MAQRKKQSKKAKKGISKRAGRRKRGPSRPKTYVMTGFFGPPTEEDECCAICEEIKANGGDPSQPLDMSAFSPEARERINSHLTPMSPERVREILAQAGSMFPPGFLEEPWEQETPWDDAA